MNKIKNQIIKLCIVSDASNVHIVKWARYFYLQGFDTYVLSDKSAIIEGVHVITFDRYSNCTSFLCKLRNLFLFRNILSKIKPDIIHIHFMHTSISCVVKFFKMKNIVISTWGKDIVYDGPFPEPKIQVFIKKVLLRWAREVTATSSFQAGVTEKYMSKNKNVQVIPFGVNCEKFSPLLKKDVEKDKYVRLGFVKHLLPKYGPKFIIQAMPVILREYPDTKLILVGSGYLENQLRDLCIQLGIKDYVEFVGSIHHDKVPKLLAKIDIFIMPSIYNSETFGVAAVEASAMEIPVVASRVGGVPEVVIDGVTGILVEPCNYIEISKAIKKLISNPELRFSMGREGRKLILGKYNLDKAGKMMHELYRKFIGKETSNSAGAPRL